MELLFSDARHIKSSPVYRFAGTRNLPKNVRRTTKFKGGGIMVWGCIRRSGVAALYRVLRYVDGKMYVRILQRVSRRIPLLCSEDEDAKLILQQDNASCHTANIAEAYLARNNFTVLPWPPLSPDLSPIETVWAYMARTLRNRTFRNNAELWTAVKSVWRSIPGQQITDLYDSIPRRIKAVVDNRGDVTRY